MVARPRKAIEAPEKKLATPTGQTPAVPVNHQQFMEMAADPAVPTIDLLKILRGSAKGADTTGFRD